MLAAVIGAVDGPPVRPFRGVCRRPWSDLTGQLDGKGRGEACLLNICLLRGLSREISGFLLNVCVVCRTYVWDGIRPHNCML